MNPYRTATVIGHLKMVRSVVVDNLGEYLNWAWGSYLGHVGSPCHRKTLLPFLLGDDDFAGCCAGSLRRFRALRANRAELAVDTLDFVTASRQEDKGDQEGDRKRDKGQEGNTPTAAGQGGEARRGETGETCTALGQEGKEGGEVMTLTGNEEEREGAVGKGKQRKKPHRDRK